MHIDGITPEERAVHHVGEGDLDPFPRIRLRRGRSKGVGVVEGPGETGKQQCDQRIELARRQIAGRQFGANPGHALIPHAYRRRGQLYVVFERRWKRLKDRTVACMDVAVAADPGAQTVPSGGVRRQRVDRLRRRADLAGDLARQAAEDLLLPREVLVEGDSRAAGQFTDASDAALMKAFLTEQLQRSVQNALPGPLPACAHPRIVREGRPSRDGFGIGALRHR